LNNSDPTDNENNSIQDTDQIPASVKAARWLFILLGIIWLVFGTWSIMRIGSGGGNMSGTILWVIAVLMYLNSALLIWIGWRIGKGLKLYYYFGILVLSGNIFLTLTDEFGVFDLIVLVIAVGLFILLIVTRSKYLKA
jgi:hypothetical protein